MSEIWNLSALCRCCHIDGSFKRLDVQAQGAEKTYAVMLLETIGVSISTPPDGLSYSICDVCIYKLKETLNFKLQIVSCEEKFLEYLRNEEALNPEAIKVEFDCEPYCDIVAVESTNCIKNEIQEDSDHNAENDLDVCEDYERDKSVQIKIGLKDDEIQLVLSESEVESESDDVDECEIVDDVHIPPFHHHSDDSSDDEPLSNRPTRGRHRLGRVVSRPGKGSFGKRDKIASKRSRSRSIVKIFQNEECDISDSQEWRETDFTPSDIPFTQPAYKSVDSSEFIEDYDYFKQYIDDKLIQLIVEKTNRTYALKKGRSLELTDSELYVYLGINLVMSAINYPMLKMYWEKKFRVPIIADNMSRTRFLLLRNSIKFVCDDEVELKVRNADKLWKVRPLLDRIAQGCKMQDKEKCLSIDEMMVPFTGKCGIKQYVPSNPHPTGLKMFVLANPNGIVCDFDVYQGTTTYPNYENTNFSLEEKAVLNLTEDLVPGHVLFFNKYFTTTKLVTELKDRNILCTGTIKKNRIPASAKPFVKNDRDLIENGGRGPCQMLVNTNENIALTKWLDNKGVTLLSSAHGKEPNDSFRRWSKSAKEFVHISRPDVVKAYNDNIGGVDLADKILSVCPNRYKTYKSTQRMLCHMVDLACSNAWLLYKKHKLAKQVPVKRILQLRAFKLGLGEYLLDSYARKSDMKSEDDGLQERVGNTKRGRRSIVPTPSKKSRKIGANHMPQMTDSQQRCRNCHKKTNVRCTGCDINLCLTNNRNCFLGFHS